jgi:hypothetical protein
VNWIAAKQDIAESLGYDGATSKSLSASGLLYGTPTDTRLQLLLRNFSIETFTFFTRASPVTFKDGDWDEIDLTDFSRCAVSMAKVMVLNVNSNRLKKVEGVGLLMRSSSQSVNAATGIPTKGTPNAWAEAEKGKIDLDVPIDMSGNPPAWCAGWYRHPVLTADSGVGGQYLLDETIHFGFVKFCAISLGENVTTVQGAMERLKRFDIQAYNAVTQKATENKARFQRGLYGCGL